MKIFLMLIVLLFLTSSYAQNLIPNHGFENGTYHGGADPISYYSGVGCLQGRPRFENDIDDWYVATSDANITDFKRLQLDVALPTGYLAGSQKQKETVD